MAFEVKEFTPETLVKLAEDLDASLKQSAADVEKKFGELKQQFSGAAPAAKLEELQKTVEAQITTSTKALAEAVEKQQELSNALNDVRKQLDHPLYGNKAEMTDAKKAAVIDHERILFNAKGVEKDARFDESKVDFKKYELLDSASKKLIMCSSETEYHDAIRRMTADESKAFSMSQIVGSYFFPEVQTAIRDCFLEPVGLFDLYDTFTVSKSTFMYPFIKDHTMLGGYVAADDCGTINAANINLQFRQEQVYDWRGTLCVTTRTLADSSLDLLAMVAREMALSKRMTSNQAWISGDGVKSPKRWLTSNLFPVVKTGAPGFFSAPDVRSFLYRVPPEFGNIQVVMHPYTMAVIMAMTNAFGEFMFGDGSLFADPKGYVDNTRLSRYMPDIAWTVTPGTNTTPALISAPSGSLVAAAANWKKSYMVPTLLPMMMRQGFMIQGPWCAQYHFWAQDGGAPVCGEAGRILQIQ